MEIELKKIRRMRGWKSARAFAQEVGLNVSTYTAYEQNQHQPDIATLWFLADALDCSIDQILGRSSFPNDSDKND